MIDDYLNIYYLCLNMFDAYSNIDYLYEIKFMFEYD